MRARAPRRVVRSLFRRHRLSPSPSLSLSSACLQQRVRQLLELLLVELQAGLVRHVDSALGLQDGHQVHHSRHLQEILVGEIIFVQTCLVQEMLTGSCSCPTSSYAVTLSLSSA